MVPLPVQALDQTPYTHTLGVVFREWAQKALGREVDSRDG